MTLGLGESDAPEITMWGGNGERRWGAPSVSAGAATAEVSARRFTLVDDMDRRRARLSHSGEATSLSFFDDGGRERISLSLGREGELVLREPDAERRLSASAARVALEPSARGQGFELTPTGFRGYNFWTDSDREDAHVSLWVPTDDLSHGPRLSLLHNERGWIDLGWDEDGSLSLLFDGRRIYFGEGGQVMWEPEM